MSVIVDMVFVVIGKKHALLNLRRNDHNGIRE